MIRLQTGNSTVSLSENSAEFYLCPDPSEAHCLYLYKSFIARLVEIIE